MSTSATAQRQSIVPGRRCTPARCRGHASGSASKTHLPGQTLAVRHHQHRAPNVPRALARPHSTNASARHFPRSVPRRILGSRKDAIRNARFVGGPIVDNHELEVGEGLCEDGSDRRSDVVSPVMRHEDGDEGPVVTTRLAWCRARDRASAASTSRRSARATPNRQQFRSGPSGPNVRVAGAPTSALQPAPVRAPNQCLPRVRTSSGQYAHRHAAGRSLVLPPVSTFSEGGSDRANSADPGREMGRVSRARAPSTPDRPSPDVAQQVCRQVEVERPVQASIDGG